MQVRQLEIENFVTGDESNIDNIHANGLIQLPENILTYCFVRERNEPIIKKGFEYRLIAVVFS